MAMRTLTSVSRRLSGLTFWIVANALLSSCTTTIVPPSPVERPQSVFVLDHGRHTSLVLPRPDGFVRYAYGDWDWYAEAQTGVREATRAVFWPTTAALGRGLIQGARTHIDIRRGIPVEIEELHEVQADADDVDRLHASLEDIYRANFSDIKYNIHYGLAFVPHPDPYTLSNNSNHRVAQWLRQLGCRIQGTAFWARWKVNKDPGQAPEPHPFDE